MTEIILCILCDSSAYIWLIRNVQYHGVSGKDAAGWQQDHSRSRDHNHEDAYGY